MAAGALLLAVLALPGCSKSNEAGTKACQDAEEVKGAKSCDVCCKAKGASGSEWFHNKCACTGG